MSKGLLLGLFGALFFVGFTHAFTVIPDSCTASRTDAGNCANVYDGNTATYWYSAGTATDTLTLDFTKKTAIAEYVATFGNTVNPLGNGGNFNLDVSNDNSNWTLLDQYHATTSIYTLTRFFNASSTDWRYYRFTQNNAGSNNGFNLVVLTGTTTAQVTTTTTISTSTAPTAVENVSFFVLAMIIFGAGIFLAMWLF